MPTSQNNYRANDRSVITTYTIPGTDRRVSLRKGAPGELLVEWAAWFNKAIESVGKGQLDDWGFAERTIRGSSTTLSNHASGTAIDLNATKHPLGKKGTFTPGQMKRIRDRLREFDGCIRWGGDYQRRKDEMHFEIVASPDRCASTLHKIRRADLGPDDRPVEVNHVTKGRDLLEQGIAELRKAKKSRTGVHSLANDVEARMNRKGTPKT